jgi:uncharacterized protein (TIGR02246 family)
VLLEPQSFVGAESVSGRGAAVASVIRRWSSAWNAHEVTDMATLVAPDVDFVNVGGRWLQGAKEFRQWHRDIHDRHLRHSRWENLGHSVKFLTGKLALVHLEWAIDGERAPDGTLAPQRCGIFTWLIELRDGVWLIVAAHNTNLGSGVSHRLSMDERLQRERS